MGVRPFRAREEYWYEQIKPNFIYASTELFENPPVSTEGARIPKGRPCRAVTSTGKEIVYLSSEESPQSSATVVARSSGSAGSRGPDSGATLSFVHGEEETKAEVEAEKLIRKRPRVETTATTPPVEKAATSRPIGKKGSLRSLYRFSSQTIVKKPEIEAMKPEVEAKKLEAIIPPKTFTIEGKTVEIERPIEKEGPEVVKITGLDYPVIMRKEPQVQIENPTTQHDASVQTEKVQTVAGGSACDAQAQVTLKLTP
ncbi:hypothetical protein Hanom_Chr15g01406201 [Helianthus anomalus]